MQSWLSQVSFSAIFTNEWVLLPIVPKICICHSLWWCELLGSMYYTPNLITGLIVMSVYLLGMCFSHALDPGYALFSHPPTHQYTTKVGISLLEYHYIFKSWFFLKHIIWNQYLRINFYNYKICLEMPQIFWLIWQKEP